jgi:hypothetical protein
MVRCKNAGGAPSDEDGSPPRRTEVARGKRVKIAAKKRKRTLTEAEIAQAVADAVEAAERGGRSSGIRIGESRFHLEGRQLGTEAIEETVEATEETVDAPTEQPIEDPEETKEQTIQTPQRRCSGRTQAQVTPRPEGQRRGGRPPPRARGHPLLSTLTSRVLQPDRSRPSDLLRSLGGSHLNRIPGRQRVSTLLCTRTSTGPMSTAGLLLDHRESVDWRP